MDEMRKDFSFICDSNTQIIIIQSTFVFVYKQIRFATRNKILNERALAVSIHTMKIRIALNCSDDSSYMMFSSNMSFSFCMDLYLSFCFFHKQSKIKQKTVSALEFEFVYKKSIYIRFMRYICHCHIL